MEESNFGAVFEAALIKGLLNAVHVLWPFLFFVLFIIFAKFFIEVWLPRYVKNKRMGKRGHQLDNGGSVNDIVVKKNDNCPTCGGKLIQRSGKFGKFIGCSNYPNCKYTEKIAI